MSGRGRGRARGTGYSLTGGGHAHQDWTPQTVSNFAPRVQATHVESSINKTRQQGGQVQVTTRQGAGGNSHNKFDHLHERKIANAEDEYVHKTVDIQVSTNIRRARAKKDMTQQQLAMAISEKVSVVQAYERGDAIPNGQLIARMERALGLHLKGPRALEPF